MDYSLIPDRDDPLTDEDLRAIALLREYGAPDFLLDLLTYKDSELGLSDPVFHVPRLGSDTFVSLLSPGEIWEWKEWKEYKVYQPLIQIACCATGNEIYINTFSANRGQLYHLDLEERAMRALGYDITEIFDHLMTLEQYLEKYA